jgi:uncharacterized damage-inducible protein DinB
MMIPYIRQLLERDLEKLQEELLAYREEAKIWSVEKGISNSSGNLCLHLVGNLQHFIGATIGGTGYVRNRDLEFSAKGIPREELLSKIRETIHMVGPSLSKLREPDLDKEFPLLVFKEKTSYAYMLLHLATHLGYHLGQVNYHRRLLDTRP